MMREQNHVAQAYDSPPWWYDVRGFFILHFSYHSTLLRQVRFFSRNMRGTHLEAAVGSGTLLGLVLLWRRLTRQPAVASIVAVDYAAAMLAGAFRRFSGRPGIEFFEADVAAMSFPDDHFDTVNVANAIHCFPNVDGSLREIFRVLKPGGTMAVNALLFPRGPRWRRWIPARINEWGIAKGILRSPFEEEDVRRRIKTAGFDLVHAEVCGNSFYIVAGKRPN